MVLRVERGGNTRPWGAKGVPGGCQVGAEGVPRGCRGGADEWTRERADERADEWTKEWTKE